MLGDLLTEATSYPLEFPVSFCWEMGQGWTFFGNCATYFFSVHIIQFYTLLLAKLSKNASFTIKRKRVPWRSPHLA